MIILFSIDMLFYVGYKAIQAGRDRILVKQYHMNKTWDQAHQQCEADGGHLIKLDTKHKLRAMRLFSKFSDYLVYMCVVCAVWVIVIVRVCPVYIYGSVRCVCW